MTNPARPAEGMDPQTPVAGGAGPSSLTRRPSRSAATTTFSMEVFDNEVVPSSLQSIAPILRVAREIQNERPRVAYLCMSLFTYYITSILYTVRIKYTNLCN